MSKEVKVFASILAADFMSIGSEIRRMEEAGVDGFHVDMMDGNLVSDIAFGVNHSMAVCNFAKAPVDVHLMIREPMKFVHRIIDAGASCVTIQAESGDQTYRCIQIVKEAGLQAACCIAPETPVSYLNNIVDWVDRILLVCVPLGLGGQQFIKNCYDKIAKLASLRTKRNLDFLIGVDGGLNAQNFRCITDAGADYLVAGTFVYVSEDPSTCIKLIHGAQ